MLNLRLLGPLAVSDDDGRDITPPGARERLGLVTLAVVAPDPLSTERIADELYREQETTDPRNAVQAMVSRLRRALGRSAGSVQTTTNGYRLVDVTLDIDQAERLLNEAGATPDLGAAMERLEQATGLWQGPTLDGLNGDLIAGERLRIDNLRADTEDHLFERRLAAGTDPGLVTSLEAAVGEQPLREKRWELLMLALYRQGRQADALRAFQRARSLLSDHLGLEPGPQLSRLEQQILAHDPSLDPPDEAAVSTEPGDASAQSTQARPVSTTEPRAELPSGTVSLLLCDVEGSVRQWEASPEDTAREIEELHRIWTAETEGAGGAVIKSTGDGIMAAFGTAGAALRAAAAATILQSELSLRVKVAVTTGTVSPVDGDYRGPVINQCARLLELANGGQILVSETTAELAKPDLAAAEPPLTIRDLGTHWLRDVAEPMAVWQVGGPGLRSSFPPLQSHGPRSLPRPPGELLGRAELTTRIIDELGEQPLVTLLGPGGIGKTSLAVAVAWELSGNRPVTFVDLARVTDPNGAEGRMLEEIVPHDPDPDRTPADQMAEQLRNNPDLVVVDNAEHVLDPVADVIEQIVSQEIKGTFLVTSRNPLGLPEETIIGIPPLAVPAEDDDLDATGRVPSVQLFLERARANRPDFEIPNGLLPVVAHICRRLDGIPLAIELAAGRTSLLSLDDIAARLDDQLRLLRQVRANRNRRHQSLEAVVGWSVDQLSPQTRELFVRLSVMAGSFGIDGVESLLRHAGLPHIDVLDGLDELHQASLLRVEPEGSRFRMLEPLRQVAEAELIARDLDRSTRRAHVQWVTDLVTDAHRRRDNSRAGALDRVDQEADQLLAAVAWATETEQLDLLPRLAFDSSWWFLTRQARLGERHFTKIRRLFQQGADPLAWAETTTALAIVTAANPTAGKPELMTEAVQILDQHAHPDRAVARLALVFSLDLRPNASDPASVLAEVDELLAPDDRWGRALLDMATMTVTQLRANPPAGEQLENLLDRVRASVTAFRQMGETWVLGATLGELGQLYLKLGNKAEAEACLNEALELLSATEFHGRHVTLTQLGRLASGRGDHQLASQYHAESMMIAEADQSLDCMASALSGMGHAAEMRGEPGLAIEFYQRAFDLASKEPSYHCHPEEMTAAIDRLVSDPSAKPN